MKKTKKNDTEKLQKTVVFLVGMNWINTATVIALTVYMVLTR